MKKYYTTDEKDIMEIDGTYRGYYIAMIERRGLIWGFVSNGKCDYVVTESAETGAVTAAQFDIDGELIDILPADDDINSVDDFIGII